MPKIKHPFLGYQIWPANFNQEFVDAPRIMIHQLYNIYENNRPRLYVGNKIPDIRINDIEEAENLFFKNIEEYPYSLIINDINLLSNSIRQLSNVILARTSRSNGNVILMNTNTELQFRNQVNEYQINLNPIQIGRWTAGGIFSNYMKVWYSSIIPEDEYVIIYKGVGEIDCSSIIAGPADRPFYYQMPADEHNRYENFKNYFRVLKVNQ